MDEAKARALVVKPAEAGGVMRAQHQPLRWVADELGMAVPGKIGLEDFGKRPGFVMVDMGIGEGDGFAGLVAGDGVAAAEA